MDQRALYQFQSPGDGTFSGLAMDVHMHEGRLRFFDTFRGHELRGELSNEGKDAFTFAATGALAGDWKFRVLTLREFKQRAFRQVEGGEVLAATLKTTSDLHEWYRKEFGF